jgi:hypothetical protein
VSAEATEARHDDQRALKDARARLRESEALRERLERELGIMSRVGQRQRPPAWLKRPKRTNGHRGTPWLLLSDLHLDEVVRPAELMGVNAYDRTIAEARLARTFEGAVTIAKSYWSGVSYDGIVAPLAGDIFSGSIHEELTETNEDTMLGSLDHWIDHLAAGYSFLVEEFGKVHVPVVVGNHGRTTRKPRAKMRARDNFDWFIGKALERIFSGEKRITFDVSEAADVLVPSYSRTVCITHGDQARGGGGIGGIWPPIMRLLAQKQQRYAAMGITVDLMPIGHWHQLVFGKGFIVNGSLKGYDEYAYVSNFGFEPPAQAFWLMTPEHGQTFTSPIFPMKRKAEGW